MVPVINEIRTKRKRPDEFGTSWRVRIALLVGAALVLLCAVLWLERADIAWIWAGYQDTSEAYRAYAAAWPASGHVADARARQDERDWQRASASGALPE